MLARVRAHELGAKIVIFCEMTKKNMLNFVTLRQPQGFRGRGYATGTPLSPVAGR